MKNSTHSGNRIAKARSRSVIVALAFALALAATLVAASSAQAQTFTLLYSFQGPPADGQAPNGVLIFDKSGNLYGTTYAGYEAGHRTNGTVFELDPSGHETIQHSFTGPTGDGFGPSGNLVRYGGAVYGTTMGGDRAGCNAEGCGTVFELRKGHEKVVHSFTAMEGNSPRAGLVRDESGNLYGTTAVGGGGTPPPACNCGTVFEVSQGNEIILHSFGGKPDGSIPEGSLILDKAGNLYGTTSYGGTFDQGTVFELSPNLDGTWTEYVLHSFSGKIDGTEPQTGLVIDEKGNLYGTTNYGGLITTACQTGCGVVFKLLQNGDGTWTERALYRFNGPPNDGQLPFGNLVNDRHGNLYGVTYEGGAAGDGIVFELDSAGQEKVLHTFVGGPTDGANPEAGLTLDASGNVFGTTYLGGAGAECGGCGTVFKITP